MLTKAGKYNATITASLPYLLYLPDSYESDSNALWPLILFLHGAGERGSDLELVKTQGLPRKLESGDDLPFIVIAPQCPKEDWWADYREVLMKLLTTVLANYRVNRRRIYLTGLSMGGRGTWDMATTYPNAFAAIAPICGWGDGLFGYPERLKRILHLPIWAFHGDADEVVPVKGTQWLVEALHEYGSDAKFTVYPGVGHDSWTQTYDNPNLYDWFLQHST